MPQSASGALVFFLRLIRAPQIGRQSIRQAAGRTGSQASASPAFSSEQRPKSRSRRFR